MALDPITIEVITQGLISIVREMRATVMRTAKSVAIYEAKDFSCGLFAADSQVVAQSNDIGSHVVPMPWSVRAAMAKLGDGLEPGDVLLMNDPYAGGTHLNDVTVIVPVFRDGRLVFFPAVRAHWPDVGGMVPGSMSGKATEIYQEGVRIPPLKVIQAGRLNAPVLELMLANMRVPEERQGDFDAMLAACRVAEARIQEMLARYGLGVVEEAVRIDLDRSEARMRAAIAALPDGTYHYEDYLETFPGGRFEPLLVPLALTVAGDRMVADFTGAARQVPVPVNSTLAVTAGSVFIAVKSILDPALPLNQASRAGWRRCVGYVRRTARSTPRRRPGRGHRCGARAPPLPPRTARRGRPGGRRRGGRGNPRSRAGRRSADRAQRRDPPGMMAPS